MKKALDTALNGQLCVQTWLGYANVLFIGFGPEVLPPTPPGKHHPSPLYEIETGHTDWWVERETEVVGTSDDERSSAEAAASLLVGHRVICWKFGKSEVDLEISFDEGLELKMAPYQGYAMTDQTAWCLRVPIYGLCMSWNGGLSIGRRDELPSDIPE